MSTLNFQNDNEIAITLNGETIPSIYLYPTDVNFLEKANKFEMEFNKRAKSFQEINKAMKGKPTDATIKKTMDSIKKEYAQLLINLDEWLGEGVSDKVFNGKVDPDLFRSFVEFILNAISNHNKSRLDKYTKKEKEEDVL